METGLATTTSVAGAEYRAIGMDGSLWESEMVYKSIVDSQCNDKPCEEWNYP